MKLIIRHLKENHLTDWATFDTGSRARREAMFHVHQLFEMGGLQAEDLWMAFEGHRPLGRLLWLPEGDSKRILGRLDLFWEGPWLGLAHSMITESLAVSPDSVHEISFLQPADDITPTHPAAFMPEAQMERLKQDLKTLDFAPFTQRRSWKMKLHALAAVDATQHTRMNGDEVQLLDESGDLFLAARLDGMGGAYLTQAVLSKSVESPELLEAWLGRLKQLGALSLSGESEGSDPEALENALQALALKGAHPFYRWHAEIWQRPCASSRSVE
jgi:hypothetical protein